MLTSVVVWETHPNWLLQEIKVSVHVCLDQVPTQATQLSLHKDNESHWAEIMKSHGQAWIRPTRLRHSGEQSASCQRKTLAFQQICPGS